MHAQETGGLPMPNPFFDPQNRLSYSELREACALSAAEMSAWTDIAPARLDDIESGRTEPSPGERLLMIVAMEQCSTALPDSDPLKVRSGPRFDRQLLLEAWEQLWSDASPELGLAVSDDVATLDLIERLRRAAEEE
jgi:hypothetical protein